MVMLRPKPGGGVAFLCDCGVPIRMGQRTSFEFDERGRCRACVLDAVADRRRRPRLPDIVRSDDWIRVQRTTGRAFFATSTRIDMLWLPGPRLVSRERAELNIDEEAGDQVNLTRWLELAWLIEREEAASR